MLAIDRTVTQKALSDVLASNNCSLISGVCYSCGYFLFKFVGRIMDRSSWPRAEDSPSIALYLFPQSLISSFSETDDKSVYFVRDFIFPVLHNNSNYRRQPHHISASI